MNFTIEKDVFLKGLGRIQGIEIGRASCRERV